MVARPPPSGRSSGGKGGLRDGQSCQPGGGATPAEGDLTDSTSASAARCRSVVGRHPPGRLIVGRCEPVRRGAALPPMCGRPARVAVLQRFTPACAAGGCGTPGTGASCPEGPLARRALTARPRRPTAAHAWLSGHSTPCQPRAMSLGGNLTALSVPSSSLVCDRSNDDNRPGHRHIADRTTGLRESPSRVRVSRAGSSVARSPTGATWWNPAPPVPPGATEHSGLEGGNRKQTLTAEVAAVPVELLPF